MNFHSPEFLIDRFFIFRRAANIAICLIFAAGLLLGSLEVARAMRLTAGLHQKTQDRGDYKNFIHLVYTDDTLIDVEMFLSPTQYKIIQDSQQSCVHVELAEESLQPDWSMTTNVDRSVLVGIPLDTPVQLELLPSELPETAGDLPPCQEKDQFPGGERSFPPGLAPGEPAVLEVPRRLPSNIKFNSFAIQNNLGSGCLDQICPTVELGTDGFIRSQRVIPVIFHPIIYDAQIHRLLVFHQLRARLRFSHPSSKTPTSLFEIQPAGYEQILHDNLINYDQAKRWRKPGLMPSRAVPASSSSQDIRYKVEIQDEGIYTIDYDHLTQAGVPVSQVDPHTLALTNMGNQVAITLTGDGDAHIETGEQLLFYGEAAHSKYTHTNVYWLSWNNLTTTWMAGIDASPLVSSSQIVTGASHLHIEKNSFYVSNLASGPEQDHWYWDSLTTQANVVSRTYTFTLPQISPDGYTASLEGLLKGYSSDPLHHTRILVNQHPVTEAVWYDQQDFSFSASFPQSHLKTGTNVLTVICGSGASITETVLVNHFNLHFVRLLSGQDGALSFSNIHNGEHNYQVQGFPQGNIEVFDLQDNRSPVILQNTTIFSSPGSSSVTFRNFDTSSEHFLAQVKDARRPPDRFFAITVPDLKDLRNQADYILVSPQALITAAQELINYRASQGLHTMLVTPQDIYNQFSDGLFDPRAIRNFLAYAYSSWTPPAPAYVLLFGDGHYDYLDYLHRGQPQHVPPYLAEVDPWIGETANDNYFVTISGNDPLPDMHLGRLALRTLEEAFAVVERIISYENNPAPWRWNSRSLFIADQADQAGNFPQLSDDAANQLPGGIKVQRVYLGVTHLSPSVARLAILDAFNQGQVLVNYVGHGGVQSWSEADLLTTNEFQFLDNPVQLPFVLPMTCLEGYFVIPSPVDKDYSSLAESITRLPEKGAIASFSPTGFGIASGHDYLNRGIFQAIFDLRQWQVGPASTQAKIFLFSSTPNYHDLLETYLLFGDPALKLRLEQPFTNLFPLLSLERSGAK